MAEEKPEKKSKRSKSEKKRPFEEDELVEPRKHKKSKKHEDTQDVAEQQPEADQTEVNGGTKRKKKSKKHDSNRQDAEASDAEVKEEPAKKSKKKSKKDSDAQPEATDSTQQNAPTDSPKKEKKDKSKKKDKKRAESPASVADGETKRKGKKKTRDAEEATVDEGDDAMDVDSPPRTKVASQSASTASDPSFPFYTQTTSLYVPFFPVGFDKPISNVAAQHLDPLVNHYSPLLGGVLLAYRNVNLSERPVRPDPKNLPDDHTPALLESVDEYAVGFGWLTADMDLFKPRRGAWMEGTVNLQSEGHVGVVCWDKFNASIEAKRLPAGWKWVDTTRNGAVNTGSTGKNTKITFGDDNDDEPEDSEEAEEDEPENADTDVLDDAPLQLAELHTTGYWVDASGERVTSAPLRFRIKNFDVGIAGDFGYISIEGTTLSDEEEHALSRQEREIEQRRRAKQNPTGLLRPMLRRVPEFSLTSFGREDEEEDSNQKTVLYMGSRPGTPDD
jgi:DNA-directed RNA polymerase I subunit RPA43